MPPPDPTAEKAAGAPPFGIGRQHLEPGRSDWVRTLLIALLMGVPLAAAALGLLGGGRETVTSVRASQAMLTVETPHILRSGNWFETQVTVDAAADIADLAIAVDQPLWRGMSIDTTIPDAESIETVDGRLTYRFGKVDRGERFLFKIDGQIQPRGPRKLSGRIAALDGDRRLAEVPVEVVVLP